MKTLLPRLGRLLEAGALLGLILVAFALPLDRANDPLPDASTSDMEMGESLLHGLSMPERNSVTTSMPLSTVWTAVQYRRLDWLGARRVWLALGGVLLLSCAALACELAPWPAGILTILLLLFGLEDWLSLTNTLQVGFSILIVHVAWALSRFARKPGPVTGAWAGLALGTSLLYRSPLLFLLPVLAAGFAFRGVRRDRPAAKGLALAVILPVLMLLPWMKLNYSLHGTFNPAEYMRADTNIVSGAMGLVANIEGDIRSLTPEAELAPGHVLGWAVRRVFSSPLVYARAIVARIGYAASFTPWLCLGALLAFWLGRSDPARRAVAGLAVYFLAVHVTMPIAPFYLVPFYVLLSVLVAAAAATVLTPSLAYEGVSRLFSRRLLIAGCACAGALGAVSLLLVLRFDAYGPRIRSSERWTAALTDATDDAWFLRHRGETALRAGRSRQAAVDLGRALASGPLNAETHALFAYSLALSGRPAALELLRLGPEASFKVRFVLPFFRAESALRQGRRARARLLVRDAVAEWARTSLTVNRLKTELEHKTLAKLRPPLLIGDLNVVLDPLTVAEKRAFLAIIIQEAPPEQVADAAAISGFLALQQNRTAEALPLLERAVKANATGICFLSSESYGGPPRAALPVAFFDACIKRLPNRSKLWADRGIARFGRGDPGAVDDLRKALELDPSFRGVREQVADAAAIAGFVALQKNRTAAAISLLEQAVKANATGVCFLDPDLYGGPRRAALPVAFFDACIKRLPNKSKLWADRGVARFGRRDPGAVDDLRKALELDPSSQEAVLSLAYVLENRGREREALGLVEAALARGGGGLRAQLLETAARLRAVAR